MPRMLRMLRIRAVAAVQPRFGTQGDPTSIETPGMIKCHWWHQRLCSFPFLVKKMPRDLPWFTCSKWSRWIGWPPHEEVLVNYGYYGYKVDWCSKGGHPKIVEICPGFDLDHLVSALEMSGNYSHLPRMDWYSVSGLPHVCPFGPLANHWLGICILIVDIVVSDWWLTHLASAI